jgi:hypothetical protein
MVKSEKKSPYNIWRKHGKETIPDRYRYDTWSERLLDAQISKK